LDNHNNLPTRKIARFTREYEDKINVARGEEKKRLAQSLKDNTTEIKNAVKPWYEQTILAN